MPVPAEAVAKLARRHLPLAQRLTWPPGPALEGLAEALDAAEADSCQVAYAQLRLDPEGRPDGVCLVARTRDRLILALRHGTLPEGDRVVAIPLDELTGCDARRVRPRRQRLSFEAGFSLTFRGRRGRRFAEGLRAVVSAPRTTAAHAAGDTVVRLPV